MAARVVVAGVILVIIVAMLVFTVQFFLPLSAKTDMNICCRNAMLRMEIEGGLSAGTETQLRSDLSARGFVNIQVYGTTAAKQGEEISLHVEADYAYSKLEGLFARRAITQSMTYSKKSVARKVVN